MELRDKLDDVGGVFTVEVIRDGKHGPEVINRQEGHNLIVNTGKRQVWRMVTGLNTSLFRFMRIGTSGVAPNSANTNLISPVTGTRHTVDSRTLLAGTRTLQIVMSYPSGAGTKSATNIREVVVLNQLTTPGGSALARGTFTAVNKTTSDKLKITYQCRIT
mgnify:CR=1 FL=1